MRAFRFDGQGRITLAEFAEPNPNKDEVLLKVVACAFCGSDKRLFLRGSSVIPGHEIVGIVEESEVKDLIGTRALIYIPVFCGKCFACQNRMENVCMNMLGLVGWQINGGYAEKITVPVKNLLSLPDDIPDFLAPLLLDTIGTVNHGIRLALRVLPQVDSALVFGCGAIGLGAIIFLKWLGVEKVFFVEPNSYRARLAQQLGGLPVAMEEIRKYPIPLVVEASGSLEARNQALELVGPNGAVLILGESDQPWVIEEKNLLRRRDLFVIRSFYFPRGEYEENLRVFRANSPLYKTIIDRVVTPKEFSAAFSSFASGKYIKPILVWQ